MEGVSEFFKEPLVNRGSCGAGGGRGFSGRGKLV